MEGKRKAETDAIVISDSDSDVEAERKLCVEIQKKVDRFMEAQAYKKLCTEERAISRSNQSDVVVIGEGKLSDGRKVVANVQVHRDLGGKLVEPKQEEPEVQIVKAEIPTTTDNSMIIVPPESVQEVVVKSENTGSDKVEQPESPIEISSDEDEVHEVSFLDESFSQNQEGSRRVRDFMFQQELGQYLIIR